MSIHDRAIDAHDALVGAAHAATSVAPAVKIAVAAAASMLMSAVASAAMLVAQIDTSTSTITPVVSAAALTTTSGALVWIVKQIVSGNLVHRDPEAAQKALIEALERNVEVIRDAHRREDHLFGLLGLRPAKGDE